MHKFDYTPDGNPDNTVGLECDKHDLEWAAVEVFKEQTDKDFLGFLELVCDEEAYSNAALCLQNGQPFVEYLIEQRGFLEHKLVIERAESNAIGEYKLCK